MTVYHVRSVNPLGTPIFTRHYGAAQAEAERGRRIAAGHTAVDLQVATVHNNNSEIYAAPDTTIRAGLKGAPHA